MVLNILLTTPVAVYLRGSYISVSIDVRSLTPAGADKHWSFVWDYQSAPQYYYPHPHLAPAPMCTATARTDSWPSSDGTKRKRLLLLLLLIFNIIHYYYYYCMFNYCVIISYFRTLQQSVGGARGCKCLGAPMYIFQRLVRFIGNYNSQSVFGENNYSGEIVYVEKRPANMFCAPV